MNEPTNAQILDGLVQLTQAVSDYTQKNDARWDQNDLHLVRIEKQLTNVEDAQEEMRLDIAGLRSGLTRVESAMHAGFDRLERRLVAVEARRH